MDSYVMKRNGEKVNTDYTKVSQRLERLKCDVESALDRKLDIDMSIIIKNVITEMENGIKTSEIDHLTANICARMVRFDPDYSLFGGAVLASNLEKENKERLSYARFCDFAYNNNRVNSRGENEHCPLISKDLYELGTRLGHIIDSKMKMERNLSNYDVFAMCTAMRFRLLGIYNGENYEPIETLQHMCMRLALTFFPDNDERQLTWEYYDRLSQKKLIHGTPCLFHAGTNRPQMSSCFLVPMFGDGDSIDSFMDTNKAIALLSKGAGGIGLSAHKVRSTGSYIRGTNGKSNGLIELLKVLASTVKYVDQGGGKRQGSMAVYLEPSHPQFLEFVNIRTIVGEHDKKVMSIFPGVWMTGLFMKRWCKASDAKNEAKKLRSKLKRGELINNTVLNELLNELDEISKTMWTFFDPNVCPGLDDVHGQEYDDLYHSYEKDERNWEGQKPVLDVFRAICISQLNSGLPYLCHKEFCIEKSNQKNITGAKMKSSNLCTEIMEMVGGEDDEVSVCNLASINIDAHVNEMTEPGDWKDYVDWEDLGRTAYMAIMATDKVIDINYYAIEESKNSNLKNRPVGIGVQGLANAILKLRLAYDSVEAEEVQEWMFETIYYNAISASLDLAIKKGAYPRCFENGGCPMVNGIFQFDMWGHTPTSGRYLWDELKTKVAKHGIRNSQLIALMPTASTSQLLSETESFEPYFSSMFKRRTLAGEFTVSNPYFIKDLKKLGLFNWSVSKRGVRYNKIMNSVMRNNGSVMHIEEIPIEIRNKYKKMSEIKQTQMVKLHKIRGSYVCQSQSFNVCIDRSMSNPIRYLEKFHRLAYDSGLKTANYYVRSDNVGTSHKNDMMTKEEEEEDEMMSKSKRGFVCSGDACVSCGS